MRISGTTRVKSRWQGWLSPAPDSALAATVRQGRSPWTEWVHLLWTAWVFTTPLFSPGGYDARWAVLTLVSYPAFVLLYGLVLLRPQRESMRYALAMAVMAIALLPWYPSGMTYFVFGCVMLRGESARSPRGYALWLLLLNATLIGVALAVGYPWQAIVWMPVVTLIVGVIVHVEQANRARDAALRLSQEEVRRLAALAERERIGRDLHDLLGHTLSLVALKSDLAARLVERDPTAARREIDAVSRVAREALAQVRAAVSGIRAAGIAAELASARLLLECTGVTLRHDGDGDGDGHGDGDGDGKNGEGDRDALHGHAIGHLPRAVETALALVLREAVTNIQRHAGARSAKVSLRASEDGRGVLLRISDDGRGGATRPGNGLSGMRERVEQAGGRLSIASPPGRGTVVEAWLPIDRGDAGESGRTDGADGTGDTSRTDSTGDTSRSSRTDGSMAIPTAAGADRGRLPVPAVPRP